MVLRRYIEEPGETRVVIPEGVTIIGDGAFRGCDKIQEVVIPEGVTEIGSYAFDGCSSLPSITIPDSVTKMGERVFVGCNSLKTIRGKKKTTNVIRTGKNPGILPESSYLSCELKYGEFTMQFKDLIFSSDIDHWAFFWFDDNDDLKRKEEIFSTIKSPGMKHQLACFLAIGYDSEVGKTYLKKNIKEVMTTLTDCANIDAISEILKLGYVTMKNFDDIFDYVNAKKGGEFTELKVILLNYKHDHIGFQRLSERHRTIQAIKGKIKMEEITNQQKYENYKQQMGRLSRAMKAEFYYEAIFIAYAVLENRTESVLWHAGVYNPDRDKFYQIKDLVRQKKSLPNKYFSTELLQQIEDWKKKQNKLIHALMKNTQDPEELKQIAEEGYTLCRTFSSKVTSFKRALEREAEQSNAEPKETEE